MNVCSVCLLFSHVLYTAVNEVVTTSQDTWHHFIFKLRLQGTYLVYILKVFLFIILLYII